VRTAVLGMVRTGRTMSIQITTHKDVLRHTASRVAIASGLTIVMTLAITLLSLGTNPAAQVSVGYVTIMSLFAAPPSRRRSPARSAIVPRC